MLPQPLTPSVVLPVAHAASPIPDLCPYYELCSCTGKVKILYSNTVCAPQPTPWPSCQEPVSPSY